MNELPWLVHARKYIGVKEIKGTMHNQTIQSWLHRLKAWWLDDETPWCGVYVAACLNLAGFPYPKEWYRALAYRNWNVPLSRPAYGCIGVVKTKNGHHVGFVVGKNKNGDLILLGGNQGDRVSYAPFKRESFIGYSWPSKFPAQERFDLPLLEIYGNEVTTR